MSIKYDNKKLSPTAKIIARPTVNALSIFCEQSQEFARAVKDGDMTECLNTIVKGVGSSISDLEVYQRAVEFFFPGAKVKFEMKILMSEYDEEQPVHLSLDSLLDW